MFLRNSTSICWKGTIGFGIQGFRLGGWPPGFNILRARGLRSSSEDFGCRARRFLGVTIEGLAGLGVQG